jgi:Xaa-Pro aminopeptidase
VFDDPLPAAELVARRERLAVRMEERRLDALFLPFSSADLEYLTGVPRDVPSFGQTSYAHGWVAGAFLTRGAEPLYVLPRMVLAFHLADREPGETVVVTEDDDGDSLFADAAARAATRDAHRVGIAARTWGETVLRLQRALPQAELVNATPLVNELRRVKSALELEVMTAAAAIADAAMAATAPRVQPGVSCAELQEEVEHQLRAHGSRTPSFPTHIFTFGGDDARDSTTSTADEPVREGEPVMFDFGAVHRGYCSDFGRTVVAGEPPPEYDRAYALMLAAQEAGRAAAVPGALAREVNAACRAPIEDAGHGEHFRHRMGHGIGLDVHEAPFISVEDETPLEAGMTFTDEPSILWPGRFGVRIEDVVACADGGGRRLNAAPPGPFVNAT